MLSDSSGSFEVLRKLQGAVPSCPGYSVWVGAVSANRQTVHPPLWVATDGRNNQTPLERHDSGGKSLRQGQRHAPHEEPGKPGLGLDSPYFREIVKYQGFGPLNRR